MVQLKKKKGISSNLRKEEVKQKKEEPKKKEEELDENVSDDSFDSGEEFEEVDEPVEEIEDDSEEDELEEDLNVEEGSLAVQDDEMKKLSKAIKGKNKQNSEKQVADPNQSEPRVIYLGRVPHGFFEKAMKGFFSQFGIVQKVRISRNKKTGKSRGYGFVEFRNPKVAKIVQETMNGYLLSGRKIVCSLIPPEKVHPFTFKKDKKRGRIPWKKIAVRQHNKIKEPKAVERIASRLKKKESNKRKKLEQLGIDYDFPGYEAQVLQKPKKIKLNQ